MLHVVGFVRGTCINSESRIRLQRVAQRVAVCCSVLQCAVYVVCVEFRHTALHPHTDSESRIRLQRVTQYVAVCCSVWCTLRVLKFAIGRCILTQTVSHRLYRSVLHSVLQYVAASCIR